MHRKLFNEIWRGTPKAVSPFTGILNFAFIFSDNERLQQRRDQANRRKVAQRVGKTRCLQG
jgi:hypothetical protein